jgi:hypothetical protein
MGIESAYWVLKVKEFWVAPHKAIYMSSGFPSLLMSTRYEEVGITIVTSLIVLDSGLQKGDRPHCWHCWLQT